MIDYIASLDSTHWVLLTFALGSSIIAIVQFMSQPEMRALLADVRDRLLINDLQAKDEARLRELVTGPLTTGEPLINEARLRELAREPYPPMKAVRWVDSEYPQEMGVDSDLAALRKSDAERSGKQISDDLDRTWSDELDRAWRRQYPTLDSFYAALRKRDAERSGKQISDDLDRTWSDELDRAWRRQYPTLDSFYAALRKRDAERSARRRQS